MRKPDYEKYFKPRKHLNDGSSTWINWELIAKMLWKDILRLRRKIKKLEAVS